MLLPVNAAMMDACVLAALEKGDTYGYRITQELAHGIGASESSLYPVLRRLLKDGCLETYDVAISGQKPEILSADRYRAANARRLPCGMD